MLLTLLIFAAAQAATPGPDEARTLARAQPVVDSFYAAVRGCGARPPFKPTVRTLSRDGIIHYNREAGAVVLFPWTVVAAATRASFDARAARLRYAGGGRALYEDIFNDLLVAHELGHWLQNFQPDALAADGKYDDWYAEHDANRIMVAFWREHPARGTSSAARLQTYLAIGDDEPNLVPPPAGVTPEDFFHSDRMKIVRGGGYGWYQYLMGRRAVAERPQPKFCTLVARWLPLR